MDNYNIKGLYLGRRSYSFTKEKETTPTDYIGYDLLVFDGEEQLGLVKPRVISINVTKEFEIKTANMLSIMDKVIVDFGLMYNKKDGTLKPKYTGFSKA